jgi:hypothetical protein
MASFSRRARLGSHVVALAAALVVALSAACGGQMFGRVYEYEEDIYIGLDGSAEITLNASIPALVMLRGLNLPLDPAARLDRAAVRALYETPQTEVTRVSREWRRFGRRFIQVRMRVADIRQLSKAAPFSWSTYELGEQDGLAVYRQNVGASAFRAGAMQNVGWDGKELVAFRLHLPSRVVYHNVRDLATNEPGDIARGNILAWEQALTDRLDGRPVSIEVRMDRQSILHRTLFLFVGAFVAAVLLIGAILWWVVRKGGRETDDAQTPRA